MILLVGRGRDRIDTGGIGALLVLGHQRRRRHLGDHIARIEPRPRGQERRQPRQCRIDQHRHPPLRDRSDFAQGNGDHVGGKGNRLGMKIPPRQRLVGVGEDQRIVRHAIGLDQQGRRRLAQQVEDRTHHLRLAAQAIGVLHPAVVDQVGGADGRSRHQPAQGIGRRNLPGMTAQRMDSRIERRVGALGGFGRQGAGQQRGGEQSLGLEQSRQRISAAELGPVEQRQPLLGTKHERCEPGIGQRPRGRHCDPPDPDLARADHRRRHMRQRGKVARRADRSLRRDDRGQLLGKHRPQQFDRRHPHPRRALRQARQFQRHHQPSNVGRHRLADPRGMAQHDVALERLQVVVADPDARQFAEAGIDSVHRLVPRQDARNRRRAGDDPVLARRVEHGRLTAIDAPPSRERHRPRRHDHVHRLTHPVRGSQPLVADPHDYV